MNKILLNKYYSKTSTNNDTLVNVELEGAQKLLPIDSVSKNIDSYKEYENEKINCEKFRLIFSISPLCTNSLFNTKSEIVKNEGSDNVTILRDDKSIGAPPYSINKAALTHKLAIENTEYGNTVEGNDFVYHCGVDIFNNHIMRSKSFKVTNGVSGNYIRDIGTSSFNTISDYARLENGEVILIPNMLSPSASGNPNTEKLHQYQFDDLYGFADSIAVNLTEEDGWVGFVNKSRINTSKTIINDVTYDYNKVMNRNKSCEFIDLYPDRSLFSFAPKLNKFRNRLEYNWHLILTYPYRNEIKDVIKFEDEYGIPKSGIPVSDFDLWGVNTLNDNIVIKTIYKHNLKVGDIFKIYSLDLKTNKYVASDVTFTTVTNGDLSGNLKDYALIINKSEIDDYTNVYSKNKKLFLVKIKNGVECDYYFRVFKKIPNLKFASEKLTEAIVNDPTKFNEFINNNTVDFAMEVNKLAFATSIYGDDVVQATFLDDVVTSNLKDNLGRPLKEVFLTLVKNNKGYQKWYNNNETNISDPQGDIEFSHAFGEVTSGLNLPLKKTMLSDVDNSSFNVKYITNVPNITSVKPLETNITKNNDEFMGDFVEFDRYNYIETVLEDVYHRFNTAQREYVNKDINQNPYFKISTLEMTGDDFDIPFSTNDGGSGHNRWGVSEIFYPTDNSGTPSNLNPEGYLYKAHYNIPIRMLSGELKEDTKPMINYIEITSHLVDGVIRWRVKVKENYFLQIGDSLNISLFKNGYEFYDQDVKIVDFIGKDVFVIERPKNIALEDSGDLLLRRFNIDIPSYASKLKDGSGRYLWRDIVPNSSSEQTVFTNGAVYLHKNIKFYLKRQDPFQENSEFGKMETINQVGGDKKDVSYFEYKDPTKEAKC